MNGKNHRRLLETSLYFGKKMPIYLITVQCVKTDFDDHKFTQGGEKRMNTVQSDSYAASAYAQNTTKTQKEETGATRQSSQTKNYGKTIGEPKLSDEAAKYYDQLKSKFGNMDFILVSKDMKEQAKAQAAAQHGTAGSSCESDQKARGETPVNSVEERISNFRKRIAERQAKEGKNYLSFYSVTADSYEIL